MDRQQHLVWTFIRSRFRKVILNSRNVTFGQWLESVWFMLKYYRWCIRERRTNKISFEWDFQRGKLLRYNLFCMFTTRKRSMRRLCFHRWLSVHRGRVLVSVQGVSVQVEVSVRGGGGLCPGEGSLSGGVSVRGGSLSRGGGSLSWRSPPIQ